MPVTEPSPELLKLLRSVWSSPHGLPESAECHSLRDDWRNQFPDEDVAVDAAVRALAEGYVNRLNAMPVWRPVELEAAGWLAEAPREQSGEDLEQLRLGIDIWAASMSLDVRSALRRCVQQLPSVADSPQDCHDRLREACPECGALIELLAQALDEGVVSELRKLPAGTSHEFILPSLMENWSVEDTEAKTQRWAIESWAAALTDDPIRLATPIDRMTFPPFRGATGERIGAAVLSAIGGALAFLLPVWFPANVEMEFRADAMVYGALAAAIGGFLGSAQGIGRAGTDQFRAALLSGMTLSIGLGVFGGWLLAECGELIRRHFEIPLTLLVIASLLCGWLGFRFGKRIAAVTFGFFGVALLYHLGMFLLAMIGPFGDPEYAFVSKAAGIDFLFSMLFATVAGFSSAPVAQRVAERAGRRAGHDVLDHSPYAVSAVAWPVGTDWFATCDGEPVAPWLDLSVPKQAIFNWYNKPADGVIQIRDADTGEIRRELRGHRGPVRNLAASADGRVLVSTGADLTIRLWDMESGQETRRVTGHWRAVTSLALSPDCRFIATGSLDGTVRVWALESGEPVTVLTDHAQAVTAVAFDPADSTCVVSASHDGTIRTRHLDHAETVQVIRLNKDYARCLLVQTDCVVAGLEKCVAIFDRAGGNQRNQFPMDDCPRHLMTLYENAQFSVAVGNAVFVQDLSGGPAHQFRGGQEPVNSVAWRADGRVFLSGSQDGALRLRRIDSPHAIESPGAHSIEELPADATGVGTDEDAGDDVGESSDADQDSETVTAESHVVDVEDAVQPVAGALTPGWRLAGVVLGTLATTVACYLAGLAIAAIAVQLRIFQGLMALEPVYSMRGFWSGTIYRVSDDWTTTGSIIGVMIGLPAGILITRSLFGDDWSAALVRSRAATALGRGVAGAVLVAIPLLPVMAITFYFRDRTVLTWLNLLLFLPMLAIGAMVIPCWIAGGLHGAFLAARPDRVTGRERWTTLLSTEEQITRRAQIQSRLRAAVWIVAIMAVMFLLMFSTAGRFGLGGTDDGQGAASRDSVDDPNFVSVDEIAKDYRARSDYATRRYGGHHFQFKGILTSLAAEEVTLADESGRRAVRCQMLPDEEYRLRIKINRWLTEDYHFVALRRGDPVVMYGSCRGPDADGLIRFEEAGFHRWSMEHGATDPGD